RGNPRRLLDPAARLRPDPGSAPVLGPDGSDAARPRLAVLALGLAPVPRGAARSARAATRSPGTFGRRGDDPPVPAAAEDAAAASCPQRCALARLRGRAHALVLCLPRLVLPVLRLRRLAPGRRARAGRGKRVPWTHRPRDG